MKRDGHLVIFFAVPLSLFALSPTDNLTQLADSNFRLQATSNLQIYFLQIILFKLSLNHM